MTSDTTGPRTNQHGDPCPGWCTTDHARPWATSHVGGDPANSGTAARGVLKVIDPASVLFPEERRVTVYPPSSAAALTAGTGLSAGRLADFLDDLAGVPAKEIREMAAAVRAAAAGLFGEQ